MPDDKDRLTDQEQQKATEWIKQQADRPCPACGRNEWIILPHLLDFRAYRGGAFVVGGGTSYPAIGLICNNCGNFRFHNAIIMGILKPEEKEGQDNVRENVLKYSRPMG